MFTRKAACALVVVLALLLGLAFSSALTGSARALPPSESPNLSGASGAQGGSVAAAASPRSNFIPAVVYVSSDRHIHEIALKGTWQDRDLTAAAGAPTTYVSYSRPVAHRRTDGVSMVVYQGSDNHVQSLHLELQRQGATWQEIWHWADLSAIAGSPDAAGEPYAYVRGDGISAVVYRTSDGHVHELRLEGGWVDSDLTAISGAPAGDMSDPVGYVRGDGISAVVFARVDNGHIYELRLDQSWKWADLSAVSGAPAALQLAPYLRSDGISAVSYIGRDVPDIYELRLDGGWVWSDLTAVSGAYGPPGSLHSYVRGDGINAVVYSVFQPLGYENGRTYELRLENGWQWYELTSVANAVRGLYPVGYVRADGISAVVYWDGVHIDEIRLDTEWRWADLTYLAGAPAANGAPWPYNRSGVARVYLPLLRR